MSYLTECGGGCCSCYRPAEYADEEPVEHDICQPCDNGYRESERRLACGREEDLESELEREEG